MKIRNGFVSNSSSSSYIIALKKDTDVCPHCGRKDPSLLDIINISSNYNDDDSVISNNTEESLNYIRATMEEDMVKKAELYKENKEYDIVCINISYHSQSILTILNNLINSNNAVKIYVSE